MCQVEWDKSYELAIGTFSKVPGNYGHISSTPPNIKCQQKHWLKTRRGLRRTLWYIRQLFATHVVFVTSNHRLSLLLTSPLFCTLYVHFPSPRPHSNTASAQRTPPSVPPASDNPTLVTSVAVPAVADTAASPARRFMGDM